MLEHVQSQQQKQKVYVVATVDVTVHHEITINETPKEIQHDEIMEELPKPKDQPKKVQTVVASKKVEKQQPKKQDPVKEEKKTNEKIYKKWWAKDHEIQNLVNYAYQKGGKDFLLTLEWENGLWKWDRKSAIVWSNWYSDYGMCQLNWQFHAKFIFANGVNLKDWFSKDFQNPYKQIDYCWEVYQNAVAQNRIKTTFYAYNKRHDKVVRFENL